MTLKRIPDNYIIIEIRKQSDKIITRQSLYDLRHKSKKSPMIGTRQYGKDSMKTYTNSKKG
ncbi:MAG: hypothetical protein WB511_09250 [Nitrososphaeraceae archaeon]